MTSILKVTEIQDPTNSNTAIEIDTSGVVTFPNTVVLGVDQTWQDVNSSRAKGTEYQNTTGGPIMVSVRITSAFTSTAKLEVSETSGSGFLIICEADGGDYYSASQYTNHVANVQGIIPNNIYYKITGDSTVSITGWAELRQSDMATVIEAIKVVDADAEWVMYGDEPTDAISFNAAFRIVTGTDDSGTAVLSDDPADWGSISWGTVKIALADLNAAEPLKLLRAERDKLIAETDWWASSDLTMSVERTTYRQALRDITNTYQSLDTVVWPVKPDQE